MACRQWDPRGLARRLPSLGAGAWRNAPLLPWRVQCPGHVCAALTAGSGGLGPVPGVVSSPFPPFRPAFPALCVAGHPVRVSPNLARWYAIPCGLCVPRARSGCPSGFPPVSFVCVCARALAASATLPPLPGLVWRTHLARSQCWALVGPFHAVRAPPRVLPWSRARFGLLGGTGGGPVPFPPTWLGAAHSPRGGCGRGDPSPTPTRALLRTGFARCGGGRRVPGGGASCLSVGRPGSGALPAPTFLQCGLVGGAFAVSRGCRVSVCVASHWGLRFEVGFSGY